MLQRNRNKDKWKPLLTDWDHLSFLEGSKFYLSFSHCSFPKLNQQPRPLSLAFGVLKPFLYFSARYFSSHFLLNISSFLFIPLPQPLPSLSSFRSLPSLWFIQHNATELILLKDISGLVTCLLQNLLELFIAFYFWYILFVPPLCHLVFPTLSYIMYIIYVYI